MEKLMKLTDEYKITQNKMDELFEQISKIMELEVYYGEIKCYPINFDIDSENITLAPSDGESLLSSENKYKEVSFTDFEILLELHKLEETSGSV